MLGLTTGWNALKLCRDMNGAQRTNASDVDHPLTFPLALPVLTVQLLSWRSHLSQLHFVFSPKPDPMSGTRTIMSGSRSRDDGVHTTVKHQQQRSS